MKKKKNHTKLNIILVVLFILILSVLIVITSTHNTPLDFSKTDKKEEKVVDKERDSEYVRPDVINPMQKENFFQKYNGNVPEGEVLEKITECVYYLTDNMKNLSQMEDSELSNEYKNNKQKINDIGFLDESDYINIINLWKTLNSNNLELSYVYFNLDSLEVVDDITKVEIEIKYAYMDEIKINMDLNNNYNKDKNFIKFYCINESEQE